MPRYGPRPRQPRPGGWCRCRNGLGCCAGWRPLIARETESLGRLESQQTGKPLRQGLRDAEITVRYFDFYASAVETFYGSAFSLDERTAVQTRWEPHGVTAHIIPWNYPLQILGRSVAPALAMGNCAVLKPAEEAPLTALKIGELALEAGLPPGALNVVPGYGESAGAALTAHPGIGHISFTGSVEVGRIISHAAADRLIPMTMELGGKSPNILFADAELDRALPVIVNSILQNGGQTCSAGSRLLVAESLHAEVTSRLAEMFAAVSLGPALDDPDLGPGDVLRHRGRPWRPDCPRRRAGNRRQARGRLFLPAHDHRRRRPGCPHIP